ncbi:MAG: Type 1 glutamine amidotransferase-like domain-containing protein [Planctomycetota bacterium]
MSPATEAPARTVCLLGPQHRTPTLRAVLDSIDAGSGPFALASAGWEEREAETGELEKHLGSPVRCLDLWPRAEDAFAEDPELKQLMFERFDRMRALSRVYRMRLDAELEVLRTLVAELGEDGDDDVVAPALTVAFESLRACDEHHLASVASLSDSIFERVRARDSVRRRADEVARLVEDAGTLLVAGGHVGILYNRMRMFGVLDALHPGASVVGWSAGAMVLTERIVLFHDSPPQGAGNPEIHGPGFGLAAGVVAMPHAGARLRLDDAARVTLLGRRFAPARPLALDDGQSVASTSDGWRFDGGARVLHADGSVDAPAEGEVR